jgi:tetratricopeptide (TPR) repeat protein
MVGMLAKSKGYENNQENLLSKLTDNSIPDDGNSLLDVCSRLVYCILDVHQQQNKYGPGATQNVRDLAAVMSTMPPSGAPLWLANSSSRVLHIPEILALDRWARLSGNYSSRSFAERVLTTCGLVHRSADGERLVMPALIQGAVRKLLELRLEKIFSSNAAEFGSSLLNTLEAELNHTASRDAVQWVQCKSLVSLGLHFCESIYRDIGSTPTCTPCSGAVRFLSVIVHCIRGFKIYYSQIFGSLKKYLFDGRISFDDSVSSLGIGLANLFSDDDHSKIAKDSIVLAESLYSNASVTSLAKDAYAFSSFARLKRERVREERDKEEKKRGYKSAESMFQVALKVESSQFLRLSILIDLAELVELWIAVSETEDMPKLREKAQELYFEAFCVEEVQPDTKIHLLLLNKLAKFFSITADYNEAEKCYRKALKINQVLAPYSAETFSSLRTLAQSLSVQNHASNLESIESLQRDALFVSEVLHSKELGVHRDVCEALIELAHCLKERAGDHLSEAEKLYRRACDLSEILHAFDNGIQSLDLVALAFKGLKSVLCLTKGQSDDIELSYVNKRIAAVESRAGVSRTICDGQVEKSFRELEAEK